MSSVQQELFEPTECSNQTITDEQAWLWAKGALLDISEELKQDSEEHELVEAFMEWKMLVKFILNLEIHMHRFEAVSDKLLERHKTLVSGLIAVGGVIKSSIEHLPSASKESISISYIRPAKLKNLRRSLDESYEFWHIETPAGLTQQIQEALGA